MPYVTNGKEQTKREVPDDASRQVCSPTSAISAISGHLEMEQTADPIVGSMVRQVAEMATFAKPDSRYRAFEKKAGHLEIDQEMGAISTPNAKPDTAELLVHVEAIFFLAGAADSIGFGSRSGICRSTAYSKQRAIDLSFAPSAAGRRLRSEIPGTRMDRSGFVPLWREQFFLLSPCQALVHEGRAATRDRSTEEHAAAAGHCSNGLARRRLDLCLFLFFFFSSPSPLLNIYIYTCVHFWPAKRKTKAENVCNPF